VHLVQNCSSLLVLVGCGRNLSVSTTGLIETNQKRFSSWSFHDRGVLAEIDATFAHRVSSTIRSLMQYNKRNETTEHNFFGADHQNLFCEATTMPVDYSTSVRVAYSVEIDTSEHGGINWIKTLERLERFAESYGNEDREVEVERSAKRVCTVPPSNSLFASAAQAVTIDNEDLQAALPNATKEDVERIRQIYPILVTMNYDDGDDDDDDFRNFRDQADRFKTATSKVLGKIIGHDDHGLEFSCIGRAHCDYGELVTKFFLNHEIPFQDSWHQGTAYLAGTGFVVKCVPLSLPAVEPTIGVAMLHVLSVLGMKAVDEPGWKVISDHYHELN
jgi:hypothetical protein